MVKTEVLDPYAGGVERAVEVLRAGQLVAFPTETDRKSTRLNSSHQ